MNPNQIENLAKLLLDGCYVFETEQFNDVLEKLIGIYKIKNSIYYLEKMSESNDFSIIFSLSYILENIPNSFIDEKREELSNIIIKAINKNYYRANFYLIEPLVYLMDNDIEYLCYLTLLESKYSMVQNKAISYLYSFDTERYEKLNTLSSLDFEIFKNIPSNLNMVWFSNITQDLPGFYQKIVVTAIYKEIKDKKFIYSLSDETNPELFDYIYLSLP